MGALKSCEGKANHSLQNPIPILQLSHLPFAVRLYVGEICTPGCVAAPNLTRPVTASAEVYLSVLRLTAQIPWCAWMNPFGTGSLVEYWPLVSSS